MRKRAGVLVAIGAALMLLLAAQGSATAKSKTVVISGKAFIFNHMSTGIPDATIKVREFPKISTTTNELGDYRLRVPNNANVTPYILSGGPADLVRRNMDGEPTGTSPDVNWHEIDLQTFHTRGEDIENANFQSPQDFEYAVLKAALQVPAREDGRPAQCVIVTTASARNVRDVDFRTYWLNTPHGVEGATSEAIPRLPAPTYFNEDVHPDPNQPYASDDGGIIWPIVPTGSYRIMTSHPDTRFASFLVTCKPGRIINANPPMGAYQLNPGEQPRSFSNVAAKMGSAKVVRKGKRKRLAKIVLKSGERIKARVKLRAGARKADRKVTLAPGKRKLTFRIGARIRAKKARIAVRLTDASGVSFKTVRKVKLPKVSRKKGKGRGGKRR